MKTLKELKFYEGLALQLIKSKKNHEFFLLKFLWVSHGAPKQAPLVLKTLPCINNLNKTFRALSISNHGANYIFVLRYLYCFGAYYIKNLKT